MIERAFVETVTGNKARGFTRRESAATEAGKELLSKFAHRSWEGVIDQVERGIKNLAIAGADEDHLEAHRSIYEGEDQQTEAACGDTRPQC